MKTADRRSVADGQLTVMRSFDFSASHELRKLPPTHKCSRNHGHNYTVTASAVVSDHDVPIDLAPLGHHLRETFDHRLLNDQVDFHPTSELLASHLVEWFKNTVEPVVPITLAAMLVSETATTSARCDASTGEVTISKKFATGHGDVTLVLGADGLDEFGFVTDFGDLKPFATYLRALTTNAGLRDSGPALVARLATWFVDSVEPQIHGRLMSVSCEWGSTTGLWERGGA
jgi:6-pyruvoyl-tetrahydropterin synthase